VAEVANGAFNGLLIGTGAGAVFSGGLAIAGGTVTADAVASIGLGVGLVAEGSFLAGVQSRNGEREASRGPLPHEVSYSSLTEVSQNVMGLDASTRSSSPAGGASVKGVQGGKGVAPSPLSKTPDAGSAQKPSPQGKSADAGQPNEGLPPQYLPGAIGPQPELHP
jgi:hypothetical protein